MEWNDIFYLSHKKVLLRKSICDNWYKSVITLFSIGQNMVEKQWFCIQSVQSVLTKVRQFVLKFSCTTCSYILYPTKTCVHALSTVYPAFSMERQMTTFLNAHTIVNISLFFDPPIHNIKISFRKRPFSLWSICRWGFRR